MNSGPGSKKSRAAKVSRFGKYYCPGSNIAGNGTGNHAVDSFQAVKGMPPKSAKSQFTSPPLQPCGQPGSAYITSFVHFFSLSSRNTFWTRPAYWNQQAKNQARDNMPPDKIQIWLLARSS
jgi:hypothetical protein